MAAQDKTESWLTYAGQVAHWGADYSAKNRTYCKASVFCIRYFWNYLYLHSGKRKFSGTFYSRGCRNRLIKSIYLQKCTVHDKLRTVHFFFVQYYIFSIFQTRSYRLVPSSLKLFFNDFSVGKIEPIKNTSCITMIIMLNIPIVSSLAP